MKRELNFFLNVGNYSEGERRTTVVKVFFSLGKARVGCSHMVEIFQEN